jgi:RNA polymerase sigma factor (sigma-70 family)
MNKQAPLSPQGNAAGAESADLIGRARSGDQAAFEALLNQYTPLIESLTGQFAGEFATAEDREDLRQEALVGFYKAMMRFDVDQKAVQFGLYAKECIRNGLISYLRRLKRHEHVVLLDDGELIEETRVADDDPAQMLADEEAYLALSRRIREVLSRYENRIWWLYLSGQTARQIASMLQTDEKSVSNAIYRIRRKLRAVIPYSP